MIFSNYKTKNGLTGAIGVIGPKRIDYQRIVPIVGYLSEIISNKKQGDETMSEENKKVDEHQNEESDNIEELENKNTNEINNITKIDIWQISKNGIKNNCLIIRGRQ